MAHNLTHTIQRNGTFLFNRRVPRAIAEQFSCAVVRISLGTDYDEAKQKSEALTAKLNDIWASSDVRPVSPQALLASVAPRTIDLLQCTELYLAERDIRVRPTELAVEALVRVSGNKDIRKYTRDDARALVASLQKKGCKSATVRRRIQSLHAVIESGLIELDASTRNPFGRLVIPGEGKDVSKRQVFEITELREIYGQAVASARDTRLTLPILGETGARLAEIVGLRWEDVDLDEQSIRITPHEYRRLKTSSSERTVPLVGYALKAITVLADQKEDSPFVFPRWWRPDGFVSTHASNTLNKNLRSVAAGRTCHCFRHTLRDRLRNVEAPAELVDEIGGWSHSGGVGSRYGQGYSLDLKRQWLERAKI